MKLYICSSGSYSDYRIEAIFVNKEKAEEYTSLLKCDNDIEEFETEDENWINKKHECKYYLKIEYTYNTRINKDNIEISKDWQTTYYYDFDENDFLSTRKHIRNCSWSNEFEIMLYYPCNKDVTIDEELKNKYLKICRDYLTQAKQLLSEGHSEYDLDELIFGK
jgi:hypothetical protein